MASNNDAENILQMIGNEKNPESQPIAALGDDAEHLLDSIPPSTTVLNHEPNPQQQHHQEENNRLPSVSQEQQDVGTDISHEQEFPLNTEPDQIQTMPVGVTNTLETHAFQESGTQQHMPQDAMTMPIPPDLTQPGDLKNVGESSFQEETTPSNLEESENSTPIAPANGGESSAQTENAAEDAASEEQQHQRSKPAELDRLKPASESFVPDQAGMELHDTNSAASGTGDDAARTTDEQQQAIATAPVNPFGMNINNNNGSDMVSQQPAQLFPHQTPGQGQQQQSHQHQQDSQQQQQQPFFISTNAAMIPTTMPMMAPFQFAPPTMLQQAGVMAQTAVAAPNPFDGSISHEQLQLMQQKNAEEMKKRKRKRKASETLDKNSNKRKGKRKEAKKPPPPPPQDVPQENFPWEHRVEMLRYFKNHFGDCLVPKHYITQEGFKLGLWVSRLRRRYFRLDDRLVETFDHLGFQWKLKGTRVGLKWAERLNLLEEYRKEHGNVDVERKYVDAKTGFELGRFVQNLKFDDDDPELTEEQKTDLDRMGFDILGPQPKNSNWRKQKSNDDKWDKQFQLLLEYRKENPNSWPGTKNKYRGQRLGAWVKIQREEYKMAQGAFPPLRGKTRIKRRRCLPQDRIDRLNSIGFAWNLKAPRRTVRDYQLIPATQTLKPEMSVLEAMDLMAEHKLSEAAVVNDKQNNEFVGYVRMLDIIQKQALGAPNFNMSARADEVNQRYIHAAKCMADVPTVAHIMVPKAEIITVTPSTALSKVAALLSRDHIQQVAVLDDEEKTQGALLGYLNSYHVVQDFRLLVRNLPTAPIIRKRKTYEEEDDHGHGQLGDEDEMIFRNGDHDMLGIGDEDDEDDLSSDEE